MQASLQALPMRDHTVLGVCEGLGEDFGFNPLYLRLVFAGLLIWQPFYDIGAYFALGLVVLVARLLVPSRSRAANATGAPCAVPVAAEAERREELAVAA